MIGNAIRVAKIATGEEKDDLGKAPKRARGGRKGGKVRAASLTPKERRESPTYRLGHDGKSAPGPDQPSLPGH